MAGRRPVAPAEASEAVGSDTAARRRRLRRWAMDSLARREHSRQELRDRLHGKDADAAPAEIESVLDALSAEGLQSDERFAEAMTRYHRQRGKGPVWIRHWLLQRGVAAGQVAEWLDAGSDDWQQQGADIRARRFGEALPASAAERARQGRFLAQRGFTADQVRKILVTPGR